MTTYPTRLEAFWAVLTEAREEYAPGAEYPLLEIHRELPGEHQEGPDCWCDPLVFGEKERWLEWTPEELAERMRESKQ
ncbi:MAG: hypothetical protein KQJ78_07655 [Deltaproteobacteria bacterium]|nr:hypothetical protein [Deltaproteobacteria bacterium]